MATLSFAQPVFLWLTVLIPFLIVAHYFFLSRTQKKALRFANFETLKRVANERFVTKNNTLLIIRILVFTSFILALAGATYQYEGLRNDFDYVIALDTSASMLTTDIEPNRFVAAKEAALTFLNDIDSDTDVGFVTFSGVTYARNQLGTDRNLLRLTITTVNVSRISGTDIGGAIVTSSNMFKDPERGKAIILFTDGVNTVGSFVDDTVVQVTNYAKANNIVIHSVGLGTQGATPGFLPSGFNLTTSLDTETLEYMADETGGSFFVADDAEELNAYFQTLDDQATISTISLELNRYLFIIAFALLCLEWILINLIFRRVA